MFNSVRRLSPQCMVCAPVILSGLLSLYGCSTAPVIQQVSCPSPLPIPAECASSVIGEYSPGLEPLSPPAYLQRTVTPGDRARMVLLAIDTDGLRYTQLRAQALHCARVAERARLALLAEMLK